MKYNCRRLVQDSKTQW